MHFQRDKQPPPYLNRKDQYRMLGMIAMLMLIAVAFDATRKPENWNWFFAMGNDPAPQQELRELDLDDIDYQILREAPLAPETFIAVAEAEVEESSEPGGEGEGVLTRIPSHLLKDISDQRLGLLRKENEALQQVLKQVQASSADELMEAARRDVGYRVLNVEPDKHRGELLFLEGTLWRLATFPFGDPASQEDDLAQAWLFTSDSGNNPWMVLLPQKPDGIDWGNQIDRQVKVAGYFFKRYGYATEQGAYVAPLLVANSFTMPPVMPVARERTEDLTIYVIGFLVGVGCLFGIMVFWFVRSDRKFERSHLAEIADSRFDASPETVAELQNLEAADPVEVFRSMESD
ncbi:MAG: hypothetical protein KDA80_12520 [Planctomycetaceae bacterium]|nr:hypothetical protein [Planctomycetaceae bacterium]